jgi:membrane-bound lytic murein transglycosylase D
MKRLISCMIALAGLVSIALAKEPSSNRYFIEEEVKARIENMPCLVDPKYNTTVRGYITSYLSRNRENSERILGRAILYFPLFEKHLASKGLPTSLKYLPVVESALNPKAVSRVGATGLWQFMESTGKIYGLNINGTFDERSDPEKSTIAAVAYLTKLYERFNSWELALAAYNSGEGRVSRAVKRARSRNFWKVQRYLPRETRNYVPAFIAASYLMQYYHHHELSPSYPSLDLQLTETTVVKDYLSFFRVAQVTGLPLEIIELLNPSYNRGYIPATEKGLPIVLPKRVMPALKDFLVVQEANQPKALAALEGTPISWEDARNPDLDQFYLRSIYVVQEGETLEQIATLFKVTPHNLMAWNNMPAQDIRPGQELTVFHIKNVKRYLPETVLPAPNIPTLQPKPAEKEMPQLEVQSLSEPFVKGKFLCYRLTGMETLSQIIRHVDGLSLEKIIEYNNIRPGKMPRPGTVIKLKRL